MVQFYLHPSGFRHSPKVPERAGPCNPKPFRFIIQHRRKPWRFVVSVSGEVAAKSPELENQMNEMERAVAREIFKTLLELAFLEEVNDGRIARARDFNDSELRWLAAFRAVPADA